jgi:hypothetical protein
VDSLSKDKFQIWARLSDDSIILRLKGLLWLGVSKAVDYSSKADGYRGNPQMKIPMPKKIKTCRHAQKYWFTKAR